MNQLTPYVQRLLIVNVGLFALTFILINTIDLSNGLALHSIYSESFAPYQFVTYMFMHGGVRHLLGNMLGLFFFGPLLEHFLGSKKFLILYFVCGIGSGLLYWGLNAYEVHQVKKEANAYISNPNPDAFNEFVSRFYPRGYQQELNLIDYYAAHPQDAAIIRRTQQDVQDIAQLDINFTLVGASGAIFGILMAFALLFPNTELFLLFLPIPIKAKYLVGAYAVIEIYSLYQNSPSDNVAHFAHLAGMVFAFILIRYWKTNRNSFY